MSLAADTIDYGIPLNLPSGNSVVAFKATKVPANATPEAKSNSDVFERLQSLSSFLLRLFMPIIKIFLFSGAQ